MSHDLYSFLRPYELGVNLLIIPVMVSYKYSGGKKYFIL